MSPTPPLLPATTPKQHIWKFFRSGGLDQVSLTTTADLLALDQLDQKLWVALSCPVKGIELDEKTLALIDADNDGHIRAPELISAVHWACARLKNPAQLLQGASSLPLDAVNDSTSDGKVILAGARQILLSLGRPEDPAIYVTDTEDISKIFSANAINGDGVIPLEATSDLEVQGLIKDIIACVGGVPDRTGATGITSKKIDEFYAELKAYVDWIDQSSSEEIAILGPETNAACLALKAVRLKADDYFARCRLAAFDARAIDALNRQESEYLAIAAKDLKITADEIAGFPLARIEPGKPLPLFEGVNPAWAAALALLHASVVTHVLGPTKSTLTEAEWMNLNARFAGYENWLGTKVGSSVEKLGLDRARELLAGKGRDALAKLIAQDKALEPEYNAIAVVDRLTRYFRDLRTLLHNFVNFADFYSPQRLAVFQAGTFYVDSRSCELCVHVEDPAAHVVLASNSRAYIAYIECRRTGGHTMKIAVCVTQGDSDYLMLGRNGIFYDRKGRDWDATIIKIVDNPISLRQAFWSPYKKVIRMIEDHIAKRAAAADAETGGKLAENAQNAASADQAKGAPKKIDIGTVAALGVAVGAIGGALATVATGLAHLDAWKLPLVIVAVILIISIPSMVIAWLKLRQRTIGPILDANGWAINGRVKINLPFGAALTERAVLPPGSQRSINDPYAEKKTGRHVFLVVLLILLLVLGLAKLIGFWPFASDSLGDADSSPAIEAMS